MQPLLANPALDPTRSDILDANAHFQEMLAIRRSSRLFRLRTADQIIARLQFENTGPGQIPGLIVERLFDADGSVDRRNSLIVSLFNANDEPQTFALADLAGRTLTLHPILKSSSDPIVRTASFDRGSGSFFVPARTAAVFIGHRPLDQQIALLGGDVDALVAAGALNVGEGEALKAKLDAARGDVAQGAVEAARGSLGAFLHQVQAFVDSRRLTSEQASALVEETQAILSQI
jgi:hypothetical protein